MNHLLIITTSYPDNNSGQEAAGSFVSDVAKELSKSIKITVVAPSLNEHTEKKTDTLTIRFFKVPSLPLSLLSPFSFFSWKNIITTMNSGQTLVDEVLSRQGIDHILAFGQYLLVIGPEKLQIVTMFHSVFGH